MPETNALESRIAAIFEERLGLSVPAPDTDLFRDGVLDSLSFVNLLVELEKEYGITVALEDLELDKFQSIRSIATFIADRRRAGAAPRPEAALMRSVGKGRA